VESLKKKTTDQKSSSLPDGRMPSTEVATSKGEGRIPRREKAVSICVCCSQGCPKDGAVAQEGDRWCRQCQMDGCPQPKLPPQKVKVESQEGGNTK
jgi:hypothetical protein